MAYWYGNGLGAITVDLASYLRAAHSDFRNTVEYDHRKTLIDQIATGARSPQSVMDELSQGNRDTGTLRRAQKLLYDHSGRRLNNYRGKKDTPLNLATSRITRRKPGKGYPEEFYKAHEAVFDLIPPKTTASSVEVIHPERYKDGRINGRRPIARAALKVSREYGYFDGDIFIPVYDSLRGELPRP